MEDELSSDIISSGLVNLNACERSEYELLAASVLHFTPAYASTPKEVLDSDKLAEVKAFFVKHRKRLYDRNCTKRPIYSLKMEENQVQYDGDGVPILQIHTYVKGQVTCTKQLLYKESMEVVLNELHYVRVTEDSTTCLTGGINALSKLFSSKYLFKGSFKIIKSFLSKCHNCRVNIPLPATSRPPPIPIRTFRPHDRLQCDLIDMAPKKHRGFMAANKWGYRYILTIKCCFSKFCWLFPIPSKSAADVYKVLRLLFIKEGAPTILQSDNGGEFIAGVIKKLGQDFNIKLIHGRPYHPQSQGQVENLNKQVKRCLARFLQCVRVDQQANLWPILLSGIADILNNRWHSTINDIPFRVYRNREPSSVTSHIVPDDAFLVSSLEEPSLSDYEFDEEEIGMESHEVTLPEIDISSDVILSSSFGNLPDIAVGFLKNAFNYDANFSEQKEVEECAGAFEVGNISQFLGANSSEFQVLRYDVLEATEYTIQKNIKRSKAGSSRFKVGDEVIYQVQQEGKTKLKKKDPFQALNEVGVIEEVLPGGMYRVNVENKEGHSVFAKCVFGGQMVKLSPGSSLFPSSSSSFQFSVEDLHNSISEYASLVRGELYDAKLRRKISKNAPKSLSNIDKMFHNYCNVLDAGLLAMVSSSLNKDKTAHFHQCFDNGIKELKSHGFHYFLYGTLYWERERKKKLSEYLSESISTMNHLSSCYDCMNSKDVKPCNHSCCQEMVLQLALKSGLIEKQQDGVLVLSLNGSRTKDSSPSQTNKAASERSSSKANNSSSSWPNKAASEPSSSKDNNSSPSQTNKAASKPSSSKANNSSSSWTDKATSEPSSSKANNSSSPQTKKAISEQPLLEELKSKCLLKTLGLIDELHQFSEDVKDILSACSTMDTNVKQNLNYLLNIVHNHGPESVTNQVHVKESSGIWIQVQGISSYCGLCAMNNALSLAPGSYPVFTIDDLDLAADLVWLKQLVISGSFAMTLEPMRCLDGDYSIVAMEQAAIMKKMAFERLDAPVRALIDGVFISGLTSSSLEEFYKLFLKIFDGHAVPSLIVRIRQHHYVALTFHKDCVTLFDSRRTDPVTLQVLQGMLFLQRECQQNPYFAVVKLSRPGTANNPFDVDMLPDIPTRKNFHCSLDEICRDGSPVPSDTVVSDRHGTVTAKDLRSLKPGHLVNDQIVNYIGNYLMCQHQHVFAADTFWLSHLSKQGSRRIKNCNFGQYTKFIFPIHCPGHWWCVLIDITTKTYWEYDSFRRERESSFVFSLLETKFKEGNIDLGSFQKLSTEERNAMPSQGSTSPDCGVYLLSFMTLFASGIPLQFKIPSISTIRKSFCHIILNGRDPSCSTEVDLHFESSVIPPVRCEQSDKSMSDADSCNEDDDVFNYQSLPPLSPVNQNQVAENVMDTALSPARSEEETDFLLLNLLKPPQEATDDIENLENMYPQMIDTSCFVGLNAEVKRYLHERPARKYPSGDYHVLIGYPGEFEKLTKWQTAHRAKNRNRCKFFEWNVSLEKWLESTNRNKEDVMCRRDKHGWVPLDLEESYDFTMWCDLTYSNLKAKYE